MVRSGGVPRGARAQRDLERPLLPSAALRRGFAAIPVLQRRAKRPWMPRAVAATAGRPDAGADLDSVRVEHAGESEEGGRSGVGRASERRAGDRSDATGMPSAVGGV